MNKRILIILLAGILVIGNIETSFKVEADYTRTFTRSLPLFLSNFKLGKWALKSWALSFSTAPLWALPTTILYSGISNQVLQSILPQSISQYICFPDVDTIKEETIQEIATAFEALSAEQQKQFTSQLRSAYIKTALVTTGVLGGIWLANKYKHKLAGLFKKAKPSIHDIMQQASNPTQAVTLLKQHGYSKVDFNKAQISAGKFTSIQIQDIAKKLN